MRETTYHLGNLDADTTLTAYDNERKHDNIWYGNEPTWNGKVALLYPSDLGYSALSSYWSSTKLYDYDGSAVKASNWMQQTHSTDEWLLSPSSNSSSYAIIWNSSGCLINDRVDNDYGVRPVLNLKSQIEILIGDGTSNSPYVVIEQ